MKKILSIAALLVSSAVSVNTFAADQLKDSTFVADSSYAIGALMSKQVDQILESQKDMIGYDKAQIIEGFTQSLSGKGKFDDKQLGEKLQQLDELLSKKVTEKQAEESKANVAAGDKFRADYAKKKGVKALESGLLYKIEKAGDGDSVTLDDTVKVHYKGTLVDGSEFDNSYTRGEPIEFQLKKLIPGWQEGIPLIKKGGKIELVIPPALGYGDSATGDIPANSTLVFEIELLDVKKSGK